MSNRAGEGQVINNQKKPLSNNKELRGMAGQACA